MDASATYDTRGGGGVLNTSYIEWLSTRSMIGHATSGAGSAASHATSGAQSAASHAASSAQSGASVTGSTSAAGSASSAASSGTNAAVPGAMVPTGRRVLSWLERLVSPSCSIFCKFFASNSIQYYVTLEIHYCRR